MTRSSRRNFLKWTLAGTCGTVAHQLAAPLGGGNMLAWADPALRNGGNSRVMILLNLAGGASYNVAPLYDGVFRDRNPTVSYGPEDSISLDPNQGLHPSLTGLKTVWDQNNLALINMVGYPDPNRSHAESTDIWFRGVRNGSGLQEGWASRLTCQLGTTFAGVSLGGSNLLVQGGCNPPRSLRNLDSLGEDDLHGSDLGRWMQATRDALIKENSSVSTEGYAFVKSQIDNLTLSLERIRARKDVELPDVANPFPNNPSGFVRSCRDAARLIAANDLQVRFIYLQRGGFDTHSGERPRLVNNLDDVNTGLTSLIETAQALGRWHDVVIVTMSEFCRTFENGSAGTDHGHSGPMFVMGGGVRGGIKSPQPSAGETSSARGFYRNYYVDFRQVFGEIVSGLGLDSDMVFPERVSFSPLGLL